MIEGLIILTLFLHQNVFADEGSDCSLLFSKIYAPELRFEFARKNLMYGEYRKILKNWKANSPKANALAEQLGMEQLNKIGVRPKYGFTILPSDLPKSRIGSEIALLHPRMKELVEKAKSLGVSVVVDPKIAVESDEYILRGKFNPNNSTISILPYSTWDAFMHEFQHAQFYKLGLRSPYATFDPAALSSDERHLVEDAKKLYSKGHSSIAVDESMAVKAQIKALERMGYVPWSMPVYNARKYAWGFQKRDIEAGNINDKFAAAKITAKEIFLHPATVWAALGLSTGAAVYYNEKIEKLIVVHENGVVEKYNINDQITPTISK